MTYVLDTTAVSAWMKGDVAFMTRLLATSKRDVLVPQPVLAELAYGIERLPRSRRRELLSGRYAAIRAEVRRAAWSDEVSVQFGALKAGLERRGERLEDFDVAIAAHALVLDAALVSAHARHMARVPGLRVEDWSR